MTHGTGTASLSRVMWEEQVPHSQDGAQGLSRESANGAMPSEIDAVNGVGQRRLSHSEREAAIELAELMEIEFQAKGKFIEAEYASHLRNQLIQGRSQE